MNSQTQMDWEISLPSLDLFIVLCYKYTIMCKE